MRSTLGNIARMSLLLAVRLSPNDLAEASKLLFTNQRPSIYCYLQKL